MLQQKIQKNYLTFKIFIFLLPVISISAMDDFEKLGFASQAEQFSLVTQKNKETVFENIDLEKSHVWPTPVYAGFYSVPWIFLATTIGTLAAYTEPGSKTLRENGLLKNWPLVSIGAIILYSTSPFIVFDSACHIYNFTKFNRNRQKYEYQYNKKIKTLNNSSCRIEMHVANEKHNYPSYKTTKDKIINFLFHSGHTIARSMQHPSIATSKEKTIVFNNLPPHENNEDFIENIIDEMVENCIENAKKEKISTTYGMYRVKIPLNENTKIVYHMPGGFEPTDPSYRREIRVLSKAENESYPFLPDENVIDLRITPDKTTLIAITPTKTIKIDLTKDFDLTKEELENFLRLKNRKATLMRIINISSWWLLFLGYSQWWFKYFFDVNMYQHAKNVGKHIPSLLFLPVRDIKNIITHITLKNIHEFLFGTSHNISKT